MTRVASPRIRTYSRPECDVCGAEGQVLYENVSDRIWCVPGQWNVRRCSQSTCGTLWLDPAPVPEDLHRLYQDYYTHQSAPNLPGWMTFLFLRVQQTYWSWRYGYEPAALGWRRLFIALAWLHPGLREWFDLNVMYLPREKRGRLLDIGCGNGDFLARMRDLGWTVRGIEPDGVAVESALTRGLEVRWGMLEPDAYDERSFDVVTLNHVIEHVPNPAEVLACCHRILDHQGWLIISTPNARSWCHRRFGRDWLCLEPPRHLNIFTISSMKRLAESAGFHVRSAVTTTRNIDGTYLASRQLRRSDRYRFGTVSPLSARLFMQVVYLMAWLSTKFVPELGEEIIIVMEKR